MSGTVTPSWSAHRRGERLARRRGELLTRLPGTIPGAAALSDHRREEILDDTITWMAYDRRGEIGSDEELETALWAALGDRVKRAHDGRYDIVRGQYTQTSDDTLAELPDDTQDPAKVAERRYELEEFLRFVRGLGETERAVFIARYSRPGADRVYGYPVVARMTGLPVKQVRAAMRTFEHKLALTQIAVADRQAFARKVTAALPAPVLADRATRPSGWRETLVDWISRPFGHDATTAATSLAASGGGRGIGTLAVAVCLGGSVAGGSYCAITGDIPLTGPTKQDSRSTPRRAETAPTGTVPAIRRDAQLQAAAVDQRARERATAQRRRSTARRAARRQTVVRARAEERREIAANTRRSETAGAITPAAPNAAADGLQRVRSDLPALHAAPARRARRPRRRTRVPLTPGDTMPAARLPRLATLSLLAAVIALAGPGVAHAGSYTVTGACADWELDKQPAVDANGTGCDFALANSVQPGAPPAAGGNTSRWLYRAPGGAFVSGVSMIGGLSGSSGWQARVVLEGGGPPTIVADCPSDSEFRPSRCGSFMRIEGQTGQDNTQLALQVQCAATSCPRDQVYSRVNTSPSTINVTIKDSTAPGATVTGGTLLNGWRSGTANFTYDAGDNVGISSTRPVIDGALQDADKVTRGCDYARKVPCPNGGGSYQVDTRRLSDGVHEINVEATDTAENSGRSAPRPALVDNTAPAAALEFAVVGGEGWRRENDFDVTWVSPKQDAAPIDGLVYRFCPESTSAEKTDGCTDPQAATKLEPVDEDDPSKGTRVERLKVPKAGAYQARLTLRDAAGNFAEKTAATRTLRFDPDPPSLVFLGQDPADPGRLRVRASDATSGLARSEIEVQRQGEPVWRPLATEPSGDGFSAFLDDEALPFGGYVVRARTVDQAGNEASTNVRDDGAVAQLKLPIRLVSNLQVGARGKRRCSGRGKRRACRYKLRSHVGVSYRGTKRLYGRLRVGKEAMQGTPVEVWRQTKLPGAPLERIDTVTTSKTGRFQIKATKGPARLLRFRYPGTRQIRGIQGDVRMQVRGTTTFTPGRSRVLNGDYVTLRGRVQGGPLPATGKLVELQVYTRRQWRTFAQPRTDGAGRWEYRYRFEQIRRSVRFRFRARLRTEPGYPYETGASRTRRILVKGR